MLVYDICNLNYSNQGMPNRVLYTMLQYFNLTVTFVIRVTCACEIQADIFLKVSQKQRLFSKNQIVDR